MKREQRTARRLREENKVKISVVSGGAQAPATGISYNLTKDISALGAKLRCNCFLPKGALLKIELTLSESPRMIRVLGKVQWVRSLYADEQFEVGVVFVDTPSESINVLKEHIDDAESRHS